MFHIDINILQIFHQQHFICISKNRGHHLAFLGASGCFHCFNHPFFLLKWWGQLSFMNCWGNGGLHGQMLCYSSIKPSSSLLIHHAVRGGTSFGKKPLETKSADDCMKANVSLLRHADLKFSITGNTRSPSQLVQIHRHPLAEMLKERLNSLVRNAKGMCMKQELYNYPSTFSHKRINHHV